MDSRGSKENNNSIGWKRRLLHTVLQSYSPAATRRKGTEAL